MNRARVRRSPARYRCFPLSVLVIVAMQMLVFSGLVFAGPRIEIDKAFWDFGVITNLSYASHDFWISNSGDAPLVINRVTSTCEACLQATIQRTNVLPGTATAIHATLDLRLLSGAVSRAILIGCNDPQEPSPVLGINVVVAPIYKVDPAAPLVDLAEGPSAVAVAITPLYQLHAPLSQTSCENTNLQASVSPGADGGCVLNVRATGGFPESNTTVTVVVRSVDTNDPPCSVEVFVRNAPSVELVPRQLVMLPQDEQQTRIFWLKQHGPSPMALLDAVLPQDKYHCEIDPDPDGRDYTIYITAWQQKSIAGQTNELVLRMMDASNHEKDIDVPVFVSKP
jgi:hypothetical protein